MLLIAGFDRLLPEFSLFSVFSFSRVCAHPPPRARPRLRAMSSNLLRPLCKRGDNADVQGLLPHVPSCDRVACGENAGWGERAACGGERAIP